MFHDKDGWHFGRLEDGSVIIEQRTPDAEGRLMTAHVIPAPAWASIVASVSARGETGETWRAALDFHNANDKERE